MMQYHFFFFEFYYLSGFLQEKVFLKNLKNYFYNLKLHFVLKNHFSNRILFLLKIMLLKKITNNQISYISNKYLVKNKNLRIGG
jgi:carbonic anhydrase